MRHQSRTELRPWHREGRLSGAACLSRWRQGKGERRSCHRGCGGAVIDGSAWSHMVEQASESSEWVSASCPTPGFNAQGLTNFSTNSSFGCGGSGVFSSFGSLGLRRKVPSSASLKPAASTSWRRKTSSLRQPSFLLWHANQRRDGGCVTIVEIALNAAITDLDHAEAADRKRVSSL